MDRFGDPAWRDWDERWIRGDVDTRAAIGGQVAPFAARDEDELIAYAIEHCPLDPTLSSFFDWCRGDDVATTIVSDGLGLYIRPMLTAAGITRVPIVTNDWGRRHHRGADRHERLGRRRHGVPERPPRVRLVRDLQDAGRPTRGRPCGLHRGGAFRPVRGTLCRCRVRQGRPRRPVPRRWHPVRPVRDVRRRARRTRDARDVAWSGRAGAVSGLAHRVILPAGLSHRPLTADDVDDTSRRSTPAS